MTLDEKRKQWEEGLNVRLHLQHSDDVGLVVLSEPGNDTSNFHLHRYFVVGNGNWDVSVDKRGATLDEMFAWLKNPRAF